MYNFLRFPLIPLTNRQLLYCSLRSESTDIESYQKHVHFHDLLRSNTGYHSFSASFGSDSVLLFKKATDNYIK